MQSTDDLANELNAYGDLLFDLDNTLFSTEDYDRGAFADIANLYPNISDLASYLLKTKKEKGPCYPHLFNDVVAKFNLPTTEITKMIYCYHHHDGRYISPNPAYLQLLKNLKDNGHRLFLISNGRPRIQRCKLKKLGFDRIFEAIRICDGSLEYPLKPNAQVFFSLSTEYQLNNPVMVGDTPDIDGLFAIACKIPFIQHYYIKE